MVKKLKIEEAQTMSNIEAELCELKIENANLKSQLEDAEEKIEFLKARMRNQENDPIQKFNMFSMPMVNPYDLPQGSSARESMTEDKNRTSLIRKSQSLKLKPGEQNKLFHPSRAKFFKDPSTTKVEEGSKIKEWATIFLPLLQKGDQTDKQIRMAVYYGIPQELREVVWFRLIGNIHQDYTQLYHQLLDLRKSIKDKDIYRKSEKLIDKDLHRTFTTLDIFKPGNLLHEPLRNILTAFIVHRPDIGYVQGMSYLAGVLLMNLDEIKAFSLFITLANW
eukprot:CAMPEP_0197001246 /NCGR_PEP_ID=MMETSP1380-20130617/5983_1 /TAXON_ID=5936 /ORGANISM="Euplotes crassus, Strain CT5" /LENGTH=277 /DNA_ID=CAMNT_0042418829 /DNA_START=60 /DNA_END=891 /DNA_ORIENTATION=-